MKYLQKKKLAFMSVVDGVKGFIRSVAGAGSVTMEDCVDDSSLINYNISGNSVQNGTPASDAPVDVESVGDYDEGTGKYKIPIRINESKVINILLDEPLRKVGNYQDYVDFEKRMVVRNVGVTECTPGRTYGVYALESLSFYGYFITQSNMKSGTRQAGFCTHIPNTRKENSSLWFGVGNQTIYFSLPDIYNLGSTTAERRRALQDWLAAMEEPFLLYYPLETPTNTKINLPVLPTKKGTTTYLVETTIQPSNMEVSYYSTSKE